MSTLPNPDSNDIGRYNGTVAIPADPVDGVADVLNMALDDVSAAITRIKAANADYATGTPTLAANWNTPSQHVLRRRNGLVGYRFNAGATAAIAANGAVATIPAGFRADTVTWIVGFNVTSGAAILFWYDPAVNQIKTRSAITSGHFVTIAAFWEATS